MLIHDAHALLATLKRLHALNDSILFWNQQRSIKLMLRNDPVDSETLACELAMVVDEGDEPTAQMLDLNSDGYMDEPGTYVLETWNFAMAEFGVDEAERVMHVINRAYLTRLCGCGVYLIKDDGDMCPFCEMTATPQSKQNVFCAICHSDGVAMHMDTMACCQQRLHRQCLATWKAKSGDARCPLCRQ